MNTFKFWIILTIFMIVQSTAVSQCENRSLHFDGVDDFVEISGGNFNTQGGVVEFWFKTVTSGTGSPCVPRNIYTLNSGGDLILKECNGVLFVDAISNAAGTQSVFLGAPSYTPNTWHHIAFNILQSEIEIFLDCQLSAVLSISAPYDLGDDHYLGSDDNPPTSNLPFHGEMDEFRVWSGRSKSDLCRYKSCVVDTSVSDLLIYYRFDQGVANDPIGFPTNDNTNILRVEDLAAYNTDGYMVDFQSIGQASNFICSTSPMIYPIMETVSPVFTDYATRLDTLRSICSGEAVHLCLKDSSGQAITATSMIDSVLWQYNSGSGWLNMNNVAFDGYCFGLDPGEFTIDCSNNSVGYEDWIIRAAIDIENAAGDSCWYVTDTTQLRIFCDLDATLTVLPPVICEDDTTDYLIKIISPYLFLDAASGNVTIDWTFTDGNGVVPLTAFKDMPFTSRSGVVSPSGQVCFTAALLDTLSGKSKTISTCSTVDANPICGRIMADTTYGSMTTIDLPNKVFEVCSCDDGKLFAQTPFLNAHYIWQFSDDLVIWADFVDNNPLANTNKLPPTATGDTVYIRVIGYPTTYPNAPYACDPCLSDTLKIAIKPFINDTIVGPDTLCCDSTALLTLTNFDASLDYTWYCNGDSIAIDTSQVQVTMGGRYYAVYSDSCTTDTTAYKYVHICKVYPEISCPLAPNTCPNVGESIFLSGCGSTSNCAGTLTYQWTWDSGTLVSQSGCDIEHIPDPGGTTYTLTVTNAQGCSYTVSRAITPCP